MFGQKSCSHTKAEVQRNKNRRECKRLLERKRTSRKKVVGIGHYSLCSSTLDKSDVNCYGSLIVAFDIVVEVFRELVLTDSISGVSVVNMSIGTFEKSLAVCHPNKRPLNNHFTCSVWVMKEYGVAKSWVNQFNVELQGGLKNVQSLMKNRELLLGTTSGQLVLYNPKDQQMKGVEFYGPGTHSCYVDTYMESLVLFKERQTNSCDAVTSQGKEDEMCGSSGKQC